MKKNLLLILVILLSGCMQTNVLNEDELFKKQMQECNFLNKDNEIIDCQDNLLWQHAINLDDMTYCDYSSTNVAKNICKDVFNLEKAKSTKKSSFCRLINNNEIKEICLTS